jgi:uncharacterized membrane protein YraQ (UPF0718 family)
MSSFNPSLGQLTFTKSIDITLEVFKIFPAIFILMGLMDAWIPKSIIEDNIGQASGFKGIFISLFLGSFASGPLFASFPIALALLKKGASVQNIVIFMGAWSTIKVPMLLMESSLLNLHFSLLRLLITLPFLFLIAYVMGQLINTNSIVDK